MANDLAAILRKEFSSAADPQKAAGMQAYMKSAMPYYGVQTTPLRAICKRVFAAHPIPTAGAWRRETLAIWRGARYREERYAAIELTGHRFYRPFQTLAALPMYEKMIVSGAWWDYIDAIASRRLGPLLEKYPREMRRTMLQWSRSKKSFWLRRSAILCQLSFKKETDLDLLYTCIEPSLSSNEFFLQKAIGWALRQYAWTNPREVRRYVRAHEGRLSALSRREALKNIK